MREERDKPEREPPDLRREEKGGRRRTDPGYLRQTNANT
jgi:hypothetical protein